MSKPSSSALGLMAIGVIVFGGLIGLAIYNANKPSLYDGFAQCLTEKGVKMWGAWWCPHCKSQKELFGSAFTYVDYIECSLPGSQSMIATCQEAGIKGYPTWEFSDGSRQSGVLELDELSQRTSCPLAPATP